MAVLKDGLIQKVIMFFTRKEKTVKLFVFLMYTALTFIVGTHHEPWTDESQSWLIARDTNIIGLFKVMGYEGSPALWPIVLKAFIFFGLTYQYLYIVPFIFSTIGVWLLIYKSKIPLLFLAILPFTYYIFYQYTIVARSYCLILPCLELISVAYNSRLKKPFIYGLLLILLSGISIHMMLLSGVLFLFFCFDIMRLKKQGVSTSQHKHAILAACLVIASYLFTVWYLRTPTDCSFPAHFSFNLKSILMNFGGLFGEALIYNGSTICSFFIIIILVPAIMLYYKISLRLVIISTVIWVFLSCFYYNKWHIGMIFLSILFAMQIYPPQPRPHPVHIEKYRSYFFIVIVLFLCIQLYWSISTAVYDYFHINSGASAAAEFIKENDHDEDQIYGIGYCPTAIEPYFNTNIYNNRGLNTAYYIWSDNNGDLTDNQIINDLPEVVVFAEFERNKFSDIETVLNKVGYKCYDFDGATYIKDAIYELQRYYVYVK